MGCVMGELSVVNLILFVSASFAASFVAGLAGFAFAIVAAAVWLHFLPPAQSTVLIAAFGLIVQGWAVWKLRHAIRPLRACAVSDRRGASAGATRSGSAGCG